MPTVFAWLDQECRWNLTNNRSKIGGALDLGLAANLAAHYWLNVLEAGPMAWTTSLWGMLPLGGRLRAAVLPEEDPHDLLRYRCQGLRAQLPGHDGVDEAVGSLGELRHHDGQGQADQGLEFRQQGVVVGGVFHGDCWLAHG